MSPTLTRSPAPPARAKPVRALLPGIVALVAVYVLIARALEMPSVVHRITIVNPHDWRATVDVTDGGHHGWIRQLGVERNSTRELHEVFDQGGTWIFRFSYGYVYGGELRIDRDDLASAHWTVTIPADFAARMRAADVGPSAPVTPAGSAASLTGSAHP